MAKYITLINWTDKGIAEIKGSAKRAANAKALAKSLGGKIEKLYMTIGTYDLVVILDMPDDATAAKFALQSAAGGHIRTTTMKAFEEADYRKIIAGL